MHYSVDVDISNTEIKEEGPPSPVQNFLEQEGVADLAFPFDENFIPVAEGVKACLYRCIVDDTIDLLSVGKTLWALRNAGVLSTGDYWDAVGELRDKVRKTSMESILDLLTCGLPSAATVNVTLFQNLGQQFYNDCLASAFANLEQKLTRLSRTAANSTGRPLKGPLNLCNEIIMLQSDPPFKGRKLSIRGWDRGNGTCHVQMHSLIRHVLKEICSPPSEIKKYTLRLKQTGRRNRDLIDVPSHVVSTLQDFLCASFGFPNILNRDDLTASQIKEQHPQLWNALPGRESDKPIALEECRFQYDTWRNKMAIDALQRVLTDLRGAKCIYKNGKYEWELKAKKKNEGANKSPNADFEMYNDNGNDNDEEIDLNFSPRELSTTSTVVMHPKVLVKVSVGHESSMLSKKTADGHTHNWTVFVRPGNKDLVFTDNRFITKVRFSLHSSYQKPTRVVTEPPFEVSETGYASFSPNITIYFNSPDSKPLKFPYDMNLTLEKTGYHDQDMIFELKDPSDEFYEQAKKYCGEMKKSKRKPGQEEQPPSKSKKRNSPKLKDDNDLYLSESSSKNNFKSQTKSKSREKSKEGSEFGEYSRDLCEDLTKKINEVKDEDLIFRICELLMVLPSTSLSETKMMLNFDLSQADNALLNLLSGLLSS
ncbi:unnamed protein product [Caenorhabditis auriculariae]|uniref:YEATS domain-containing protein n=1 Tax=Caenorhabditis auriculariae TaxID=2777116 RepID=A0A8S1GNN7_9PELO|nr:unnamed protein product [Caenorhabditis auriculariae]